MSKVNVYKNTTMLVEIEGLKSAADRTYINDATGTFKIVDTDNTTVTGTDVNFAYVTSSNGVYRAIVPHTGTANLTNGSDYKGQITLTSGGNQSFWSIDMTAVLKDQLN